MKQTWRDLLFAHWEMPAADLEPLLPPNLELDTHDGHAWIGITPFVLSELRFRGLPALPRLSTFPEVNLRTYVTCDGLPGVYFFSLDAGRSLAVLGARLAFFLPYHYALMNVRQREETLEFSSARLSPRTMGASFAATYSPFGPEFEPRPGTLEHWLVERYRFFTRGPDRKVWRCEIQHRPWRLRLAQGAILRNTLAEAAGLDLPDDGPLLHYARRQEVSIWSVERERAITGSGNPRAHRAFS